MPLDCCLCGCGCGAPYFAVPLPCYAGCNALWCFGPAWGGCVVPFCPCIACYLGQDQLQKKKNGNKCNAAESTNNKYIPVDVMLELEKGED